MDVLLQANKLILEQEITSLVLLGVGFIAISLRFYVKLFLLRSLRQDDLWMLASFVSTLSTRDCALVPIFI